MNLTRQARWIYRDMLDVYYDTEKPLSVDIDILCDTLGVETDDERRVVERLLRLKFEHTGDGYRHQRCDEEIASYHARVDTAKTNGKLGGRPRKPDGNPKKPIRLATGSDPVRSRGATRVPDANPQPTGLKANQEPVTKNQEKEEEAQAPGLPDWVPVEAWNGWIEMRKKIRKPATDRAITLAIAELERLREQGHSPEAVLDRSTVNDWTGLFPIPAESSRSNGQKRLAGGFVA